MADQNSAAAPKLGSSENGKHHLQANLIVLRPVTPSPEDANSSISHRSKRVRGKWPPHSPSQSLSAKTGLEGLEVIVKEDGGEGRETDDDVEEEFGSEETFSEVTYYEGPEQAIQEGNGTGVRSKAQIWKLVCSLPSEEMFQKWKTEAEQKIAPARWAKKRSNELQTGLKRYYHCSVNGCRAELSVLYPSSSQVVEVSANEKGHLHPLTPHIWGLSAETKQEIKRLWDSGIKKPRLIKAALDKLGMVDCKHGQLSNFLGRLRRKETSPTPDLSMSELNEWCTEHSISQPTAALDGNIDRVYVFDHTVNATSCEFRFILSTKRLLKFAAPASTINIDASYSMKWFNALVLFVGVTDARGHFFPVFFAVMSQETKANYLLLLKLLKRCVEAGSASAFQPRCVIGHTDPSLTEAVKEVFPSAVRRLCWVQVKKQTTALLKGMDKETREACEKDVSSLRLSCSKDQFELAAKLMLEKWRELMPSSDVPSRFEEQFVKRHPEWYEGFDVASYSSNKSLMHAVNAVKNRHTLRERLPAERYLSLALELVLEWSVETRQAGALQDSVQPNSALLSDTCRLQREQKTMVDVNPYIYVPTGDRTAATVREVEVFESKMRGEVESFDEFVEARMSLWKVEDTGNKSDLARMRCTCPRYLSDKLCEHVLAIGSAFGLFALPQSAWDSVRVAAGTSEVQRKRGPGRPRGPSNKRAEDRGQVTVDSADMEHYTEGQVVEFDE